MSDDQYSFISWLPLGYVDFDPEVRLYPAGISWHIEKHQVDTGLGFSCDDGIVELVILLNRAGIKTLASCMDILGVDEEDSGFSEEVVRMGCVVVTWETFPSLGRWLHAAGLGGDHNESGWLFAAQSHIGAVSVLFPWRDMGEFTGLVRTQVASAGT